MRSLLHQGFRTAAPILLALPAGLPGPAWPAERSLRSAPEAVLGQAPPGDRPERFAPGIVCLDGRCQTYPSLSPDGRTLCFSVVNAAWTEGRILWTRFVDGGWTPPEAVPFAAPHAIDWESSFSPDGHRIVFASNRPPSQGMDIWMTEQKPDGVWTTPVRLPAPVNSRAEDGTPCLAGGGTLYFKSLRGGGAGGSWLYRAVPRDGAYTQVENLGSLIPTARGETEPFMAPDESYLLFISETRPGGRGGWDLWVSFHEADGTWRAPVDLGPGVNTADDEYGPRVTPDGKYLFFTRERRGKSMDILWVSARVIERLRTRARPAPVASTAPSFLP